MDKPSLDYVLSRGVDTVLPGREALKRLMEKRKITLYQGFDPTMPSLHVGHFIGLRKLSHFQKLGHKVIFLVGDFTAMIGDPTDKASARKKLTKQKVRRNLAKYKDQARKIINFEGANPAEIKFNSEWLGELGFEKVLHLASSFTVQQMIERSMFRERISSGKPVFLHEFFYPLMQGYDSVAMGVDLEIGGTDQLFNMLAGRALTKEITGRQKYVLTTKLLTDEKGQKMGKTEGNAIFLSDRPEQIFGKIMAMSDEMIVPAGELLTDMPLEFLDGPMERKAQIAHEVVSQIYGIDEAERAGEYFKKTFQKREPDFSRKARAGVLSKVVSRAANVSMTSAKRLIKTGAVDVDERTVTNPAEDISVGRNVKVGKKTFVKVIK